MNIFKKSALLATLMILTNNNFCASEAEDLKAFFSDLKILIAKHDLKETHFQLMGIGFAQMFAKQLNISKETVMSIAYELIYFFTEAYKTIESKITFSDKIQGKGQRAVLLLTPELSEIIKATNELSSEKTIELFSTFSKGMLNVITELALPLRLFLPFIKDLPKQFKKELVQFLIIKQFSTTQELFVFEGCSLYKWQETEREIKSLASELKGSCENKEKVFEKIEKCLKDFSANYRNFQEAYIMERIMNKMFGAWKEIVLSPSYNYTQDKLKLQTKEIINTTNLIITTVFDSPDMSGLFKQIS